MAVANESAQKGGWSLALAVIIFTVAFIYEVLDSRTFRQHPKQVFLYF